MTKPRILITGGAGFIGSHLVAYFQEQAEEILVLDNLRSGKMENLNGLKHTFVPGSVTNKTLLKEVVQGIDYVFHLAALVSVPESVQRPQECIEINTLGTLYLLEASAAAGVKKLSLSTTASIYGNDPTIPKREDMEPQPLSPYAITKLDAEYYCAMFSRMGRLPTVCLRYFNVFGPRQDPGSAYAAAVPIFIEKALQNEPLIIYGDGEQTRDFISVGDVAAANAALAMQPGTSGVYNVARGGRLSINDLAKAILEITGSTSEIQYGEERIGDVKHSQADVSRLLKTGFKPIETFEEGLKKTVEATRNQPAGGM